MYTVHSIFNLETFILVQMILKIDSLNYVSLRLSSFFMDQIRVDYKKYQNF